MSTKTFKNVPHAVHSLTADIIKAFHRSYPKGWNEVSHVQTSKRTTVRMCSCYVNFKSGLSFRVSDHKSRENIYGIDGEVVMKYMQSDNTIAMDEKLYTEYVKQGVQELYAVSNGISKIKNNKLVIESKRRKR